MILAATFYPTDWEIKSLPGNNGELKIGMPAEMWISETNNN